MLISFIVPMFNVEKYIEGTIKSILTYGELDYEIILVNDGSKDKTREVCEKYVDNNIVKYYEIENHGVSYARNYGLYKAKGKYVMFVDGDDTLKSDFFIKIKDLIERNSNYECYMFGISFLFHENNLVREEKRVVAHPFIVKNRNDFRDSFYELFTNNYLTTSCNKLYDKEFLINNKISFDISLDMFEDLVFSLDVVIKNAKLCVCDESYYEYHHRNTNSLSVRYKSGFYQKVQMIFAKLEEIITEYSLSQSSINEIYKLFIHLVYRYIRNELINENNNNLIIEIVSDRYLRENISKYKGFEPKYLILKNLILLKSTLLIKKAIGFIK
jgi:glycosyltransferase involved in cell wall biosynthesis